MKQNYLPRKTYAKALGLVLMGFCAHTHAQIGNLLWSDEFDSFDSSVWNYDIGDGCHISNDLCGWGNGELQYYQSDNVYIEDISGNNSNHALVIEARRETVGGRAFSSGRIHTENNLDIHYGMIEVSIKIPDLNDGLWPAAWLLGSDQEAVWPANGEIDIMEMGHLDSAMESHGHTSGDNNRFVASNAIWQNSAGYVSSSASFPTSNPYTPSQGLNNRYVQYRLYWTPSELQYSVVDGDTEHFLYTNPINISNNAERAAFQKPFYFLLNLAVGGNFTDETTNNSVTANLPAKMYVDYVRVYEYDNQGSVSLKTNDDVFGVFTDTTETDEQLIIGVDGNIYAWGDLTTSNLAPNEGDNVITWQTSSGNTGFGGGVTANDRNLSKYQENGALRFQIKIPASTHFTINISDTDASGNAIAFTGAAQYGYTPTDDWQEIEIPLTAFGENIDFEHINYMFLINSIAENLPNNAIQFAIDDIVWIENTNPTPEPPEEEEETETPVTVTPQTGIFGVYTDTTPTDDLLVIEENAQLDVWYNLSAGTPNRFEGDYGISWNSTNANEWFGGGIRALEARNLTDYTEDGSLQLHLNIPNDVNFRIGITDGTNESHITFEAGVSQYGYDAYGTGVWDEIEIPISAFGDAVDFSKIVYPFAISADSEALPNRTINFAVDNILWLEHQTSSPTEIGTFGVFTEETTDNALDFGDNAQVAVFSNLSEDRFANFSNRISFNTDTADRWFGFSFQSDTDVNMSNFVNNGTLKFSIQIPSGIFFKVGVSDGTNVSEVTFDPSEAKFGYTNSDDTQEIEIPISTFDENIDFENMKSLFQITSVDEQLPQETISLSVGNVAWRSAQTLSSVSQENALESTSLSPIPAHDVVHIQTTSTQFSVYVTDLSGKILLTQTSTQKNLDLDTTALAKGLYLVKIENHENGQLSYEKLIIE